jgi:hypothetical protein
VRRPGDIPDTSTAGAPDKAGGRGMLLPVVALALLILAVPAAVFVFGGGGSGGGEFVSGGVTDITVSAEERDYPPEDVRRFEEPPAAVYVYLTVENMDVGSGVEARVERSGFFSGGLQVVDEEDDRLVTGAEGASGLLRFSVREEGGASLRPGAYTLSIHRGDGTEVARRRFEVGG